MSAVSRTIRTRFEEFFGATSDEVDEILAHLRTLQLDGGQWLCRQGDEGGSLFFVTRGRLEVWVTPEGSQGPPTLLGEIGPGRSVGEISLLTGARRTASVRAIRSSELYVVERAELDALAKIHPAIVMKLAGRVAAVLRDRTARPTAVTRSYRTIAIVPLGTTEKVLSFAGRLAGLLGQYGKVLSLAPENLEAHGAPMADLAETPGLPDALKDWLHDQETSHRFLLYCCRPGASSWSVYAMQQSDAVLFVADAADAPQPDEGEAALLTAAATSQARRLLVLMQPPSSQPIVGTAAWLEPRTIDYHFHVREDQDDETTRVARVVAGRALGLVLAAGAARGFAHLGVFRAMEEAGLKPDWVGGTSVGAIMGACIAMGWNAEKCIDRVREAFSKSNPFGDYTIPLISLLRGRRLERLLQEYLPGRIEDMPIPYFAVSCGLDSGAMNVHEAGSLSAAIRASASMAGVMPPAVVDHQLAVDGAVINNMPVDVMQARPVGLTIAVDLNSQKSYSVPYDTMPSPWAVLGGLLFPFLRTHRVPTLMTLLLKATELGTMTRVRELGRRADLLLNPPVREFGIMEIKAFERIVDAGYRHAQVELAGWLAATADAKKK